jgi:hypothetical protein
VERRQGAARMLFCPKTTNNLSRFFLAAAEGSAPFLAGLKASCRSLFTHERIWIMSMDIFAYAVTAEETHGEEIHRWSGHSWFKGWWFDMVAIEQGVDEPREAPMVTNAELDRFETAIVNGDVLNYSFDDWKDHDLAFVAKARAALAAGKTVVLEHPVFTGTVYNPFYRKIIWRRVNQTWQLMLGFQCVAHIERSPNEGWPERYWMTVPSGNHEDYGYYGAHFSKLKDAKAQLVRWCHAVFNFGDPAENAAFWAQARKNGFTLPEGIHNL